MEEEKKSQIVWKCPQCNCAIETLNYNVGISSHEYGTASLTDEKPKRNTRYYDIAVEHNSDDQGDSNWEGSPNYSCPECDEEIEIKDLIWIGKEKKPCEKCKKEIKNCNCSEPEETKFKIILAKHIIIDDDKAKDSSSSTIICKKCKHIFVAFGGEKDWSEKYSYGNKETEESCECPKCGTTNSIKEFQQLIKDNFFSQKRTRSPIYDRKKITN